jgi:hypothetical protein
MTKKSIFRDQFSWKVRNFSHARSYFRSKAQRKTRFPLVLCSLIRNFAQNLCENGLHLGKERALCTRFAPSLSHVFSQRHHFLLLNYPVELLPRKGLNEQTYTSLKLRTKRRLHHRCIGAVAGLTGYMGRGLRFLYARMVSAFPTGYRDKVITIKRSKI